MGTVRETFSQNKTKSVIRTSYNPSVLDIFAIKEEDDPFQRTPSIRASLSPTFHIDGHDSLTSPTPISATFPHTPAVPSPLIQPPTPMYIRSTISV